MPQGKAYNEEKRKEIVAYANRHTIEKAAKKFRCSESSVSRWRVRMSGAAPKKSPQRRRKPASGGTDLGQLRDLMIGRAADLEDQAVKLRAAAEALE